MRGLVCCSGTLAILLVTAAALAVRAEGPLVAPHAIPTQGPGVPAYLPPTVDDPDGHYQSLQYLHQHYDLKPGERVLYFRLVPYQHYGRHRLGVAEPGLTAGFVEADVYPYRYDLGFVPVRRKLPPLPDPCAVQRERWEYRFGTPN